MEANIIRKPDITGASIRLMDLSNKIKSVDYEDIVKISFRKSDLNAKSKIICNTISTLKGFHGSKIVYLFRVESKQIANKLKAWYPTSTKELTMAKNNTNNLSEILYVGSSRTDMSTRFRQHLGLVGDKVFALHLSHWITQELKDVKFFFDCWKLNNINSSNLLESNIILQAIEDDLWRESVPMFGRCGSK